MHKLVLNQSYTYPKYVLIVKSNLVQWQLVDYGNGRSTFFIFCITQCLSKLCKTPYRNPNGCSVKDVFFTTYRFFALKIFTTDYRNSTLLTAGVYLYAFLPKPRR